MGISYGSRRIGQARPAPPPASIRRNFAAIRARLVRSFIAQSIPGRQPMHVREPTLKPVSIDTLRPTQMTVGMREVEEKRKRWREHKGKKKSEFLGSHMIPVIRGP